MLDEQIGLLTLLKEFDSICKKHNITYLYYVLIWFRRYNEHRNL